MSSNSTSTVYCVCRSSDCSTFMIACDECNIWYHGSCIGISEKESARIEHFFCHRCRHKNPSLQIKYNRSTKEIEETLKKSIQKRLRKEARLLDPNGATERLGETSNSVESLGYDDSMSNQSDSSSSSTARPMEVKPVEKRRRDISTDSAVRRTRRHTETNNGRQCFGPGCAYEARPMSKYCSDKCGLELARNRLLQFLPVRLMQWQNVASVADQLNRTAIEEVQVEIETIKHRLTSLEEKKQLLDQVIERGKQLKAVKEANKNEANNDDHDSTFFCVLCNQEVNQKAYQRHIDKCFIRFESQVSYGSNVKSNIEGLFCDAYDRTNNLYCKRLKVICPEHSREPKVAADEACGCPVEKNLFDTSDDLCLVPKRLCSKHFKWDRKRRAQIDLERLHELMRLEELIEKENRLKTAMQERGSVIGLLIHKTIVH